MLDITQNIHLIFVPSPLTTLLILLINGVSSAVYSYSSYGFL